MPTQPEAKLQKIIHAAWLPAVITTGLAARFRTGAFGFGFDYDSYRVVLGVLGHGQNVYAHTERYNYGPIWFNFLHLLFFLVHHNAVIFRWLLIGFLSAADVGILWVLWRKYGRLAATLFFLNPVSIMITGYQNQFDNVAILLGLWAVLLMGDDFEKPVDKRKFSGLVLLGLSLMTKHVLFAFPFWLAVKQKGVLQKCVILIVPVVIFLLGFAPYWAEGRAGIIANVFLYRSNPSPYLYQMIAPYALQSWLAPGQFWLLLLALFAFICRRKSALESLLLYTCVLVAASPATAVQYLAIPSAFTSVFVNYFTVFYTFIAASFVATDPSFYIFHAMAGSKADLAIYALALALVWVLWRDNLINFMKRCQKEINAQLGHED